MYRSFSEHLNICRSWSQMLSLLCDIFSLPPLTEKWTVLAAISLKTSRISSCKSFSHVNHCKLEQQRLVGQDLSLNVSGKIATAHQVFGAVPTGSRPQPASCPEMLWAHEEMTRCKHSGVFNVIK